MSRYPILPEVIAEQHRARAAVRAFCAAIRANDRPALVAAIEAIDLASVWRDAFVALRGIEVCRDLKRAFERVIVSEGDKFRAKVDDDRVLIVGLRVLLPSYRGRKARRLWRGESGHNVRRRTYGLSWTTHRFVAEQFGRQSWRDRGALIVADVPATAIINAPDPSGARGVPEFLVDRFALPRGAVRIVDRYDTVR
jgi:hypothetical protein